MLRLIVLDTFCPLFWTPILLQVSMGCCHSFAKCFPSNMHLSQLKESGNPAILSRSLMLPFADTSFCSSYNTFRNMKWFREDSKVNADTPKTMSSRYFGKCNLKVSKCSQFFIFLLTKLNPVNPHIINHVKERSWEKQILFFKVVCGVLQNENTSVPTFSPMWEWPLNSTSPKLWKNSVLSSMRW